MAYKTRREQRYEVLLYVGCPKWEARPLSRIPQTKAAPYMKVFIDQRNAEYEKAIKVAKRKGLTETQFNNWWGTHIKRRYIALGLKRKGDRWGATVAFRMIKTVKDRYKDKRPDYESPWEGRRRRWKDVMAKVDRAYELNPRPKKVGSKLRGASGDRWVE